MRFFILQLARFINGLFANVIAERERQAQLAVFRSHLKRLRSGVQSYKGAGAMMEKITSHLIGVGLIGFGVWIVTAEARAHLLAFGIAISIIPVATGLLSIFNERNNGSS